ncbi:thiamine phosphate synthase [bacterium]|nr:thiamine phosphate synthase [bacterium]
MMIPRLIAITPPDFLAKPDAPDILDRALAAGLPAVMLRDKSDTADSDLAVLAAWLRTLTRSRGAQLIVNRRLGLARAIDADGIHLGADGPSIAEVRAAMTNAMIGWSAHSPTEAMRAFDEGADYVMLSPIYATPDKGRPLGLAPLRQLTGMTTRPVIALGGIGPESVSEVIAAGAYGIAAIRSVFGQIDPAPVVKLMLKNMNS